MPFWKGRGLGSGLRTLPLGRDRWGRNSTKGGYIPNPYGRDLGLGYRVRTLPLGFLSPTRGTEGVVKTIEKAWLEVKLSLQERQRGRKTFEKGHWDSRIYFMNFA